MLAQIFPFVLTAAGVACAATSNSEARSLYVDVAPTYLRPYVIQHYASAQGITIGPQYYRFYVTGPSSNHAFTLMGTNAPQSSDLGVLPHHHQRHFENFFNLKGRFQLFAEPKGSGEQEARTLTQHDFGAVPRNATHTFKILDPDTEISGFIVPGGFEDLFLEALGGTNVTSTTHTPYVPTPNTNSSTTGPDAGTIASLQEYDVYAETAFVAEVNTSVFPANATWHTDANTLGEANEPYFVANGWGAKYLNSQAGYQIIQPLVSPAQSQDTNFTLSLITINKQSANITLPSWNLPGTAAFQVLEGQLSIEIEGYPTASLLAGDVVLIPGNITYKYWSDVAFTKAVYISGGTEGVDQQLIKGAREWDYVVFPME
ncbi:quercetin 2,3-dioxygenase [Paraphoma chrysanthemicola]|nr:quercetin 2,3-dioxygenase [Paraphoma chrysanthemicola]